MGSVDAGGFGEGSHEGIIPPILVDYLEPTEVFNMVV